MRARRHLRAHSDRPSIGTSIRPSKSPVLQRLTNSSAGRAVTHCFRLPTPTPQVPTRKQRDRITFTVRQTRSIFVSQPQRPMLSTWRCIDRGMHRPSFFPGLGFFLHATLSNGPRLISAMWPALAGVACARSRRPCAWHPWQRRQSFALLELGLHLHTTAIPLEIAANARVLLLGRLPLLNEAVAVLLLARGCCCCRRSTISYDRMKCHIALCIHTQDRT